MTKEQQELVNRAIALLEQARNIEEVHSWLKNRAMGVATRIEGVDVETVQAAIDAFNDREQAACTREFVGVLDELTKAIIRG
ncbi:hypothetical protein [Sporomusa sphaeroides]|uniref:Uncharacterized protein n=1 Tax=Sporomusa sphaeroides DSM 2875 TaxID=1337886 RepID=A0ABM9VY66_9FIRM|nr:hypothetical protein [Sporomusa sphaeroides]OLS58272.1 hypothetical protein SPSPH_18080 [Sporomusa sphaeroides DSM 2875]CVK17541.1 hypothetical protein SSPH_00175 [Sporomusa sphaeroides DSM 2875]